MNKDKQICDGCGIYYDESFIKRHRSGKNFCNGCKLIVERKPSEVKPFSQKEFNKLLERFLVAPPLRLKDLQIKLKRGRQRRIRTKQRKIALSSKRKKIE